MFIVPVSRDSRHLARLFDQTVDRFLTTAEAAPRTPALDVAESDTAYTVQLEVPGVAKEDVKVSVDGRRVTVSAKTQTAVESTEADKGAKAEAADRIVYRERSVTSYSRSFSLPVEVEQAEANAKLENGVLTLVLPKRHVRAAAQLTIN